MLGHPTADSHADHCSVSPILDLLKIQTRLDLPESFPLAFRMEYCCAETDMEALGRIRVLRVSIDCTKVADYHLKGVNTSPDLINQECLTKCKTLRRF